MWLRTALTKYLMFKLKEDIGEQFIQPKDLKYLQKLLVYKKLVSFKLDNIIN